MCFWITACEKIEILTYEDPRDGAKYEIIQIGQFEWMTRSMEFQTTDCWCYVDTFERCDPYGKLYTWDDAFQAVPPGWHLPTVEEFQDLLANSDVEDLLKSDTYGFKCELGGFRDPRFGFRGIDTYGCFWTSKDSNSTLAAFTEINGLNSTARIRHISKDYAFNVRCVRDR